VKFALHQAPRRETRFIIVRVAGLALAIVEMLQRDVSMVWRPKRKPS